LKLQHYLYFGHLTNSYGRLLATNSFDVRCYQINVERWDNIDEELFVTTIELKQLNGMAVIKSNLKVQRANFSRCLLKT